MITTKLSEIAQCLGQQYQGRDITIAGISIDSRTLNPGDLYVAIKGKNFDGHDFVEQAQQRGAVAAVVAQSSQFLMPTICVHDTVQALGQIAAYQRQQMAIPVIGITGSCGKTTTKAMTANILRQCGKVLATEGTLNNDIGVPLTLLNLNPEHEYAVVELGANHPGEIATITNIAKPTVAVITNIAPVHLEGFGSIDGVASAKAEIFTGLNSEGTAVISADNSYASFLADKASSHKIIRFGTNPIAQIRASNSKLDPQNRASFDLHTPKGKTHVKLAVMGNHNVANALAAAAASYAVGASMEAIKTGLELPATVAKRLIEFPGKFGGQVIDDSYNANPSSIKAALEILARKPGKKVFAFGDMLELGKDAKRYHSALGKQARELGVQYLFAYGELAKYTAEAFGDKGYFFQRQADLTQALEKILEPDMVVLVKGSKAMHMWDVVKALVDERV